MAELAHADCFDYFVDDSVEFADVVALVYADSVIDKLKKLRKSNEAKLLIKKQISKLLKEKKLPIITVDYYVKTNSRLRILTYKAIVNIVVLDPIYTIQNI